MPHDDNSMDPAPAPVDQGEPLCSFNLSYSNTKFNVPAAGDAVPRPLWT